MLRIAEKLQPCSKDVNQPQVMIRRFSPVDKTSVKESISISTRQGTSAKCITSLRFVHNVLVHLKYLFLLICNDFESLLRGSLC